MSRRADVGKPGEFAVRSALEELGNLCGCRVGVCAAGLEGPLAGVALDFGEDEAFPSASLIKVLVEGDVGRAAAPVAEALRALCGFYAGTDGG